MNKYKICVYAICKNEEKFVDRWVKSMMEADDIYVLDTGSTDNTVEKLEKYNVHVSKDIIKPWRFDVARNKSLELIPNKYDIYVCTDLDEVFLPGWRKHLEENWNKDYTRARYNYNWSLDKDNKPLVNFYLDKIHIYGYKWVNPVHEVLCYDELEKYLTIDEIVLNHYPDSSKSRSSYLPLLELSVKEDPDNDRNMHYLGREYMYYKRWNECIDTLKKHLSMKKATWKDERCASMRYISRCYINLNRYEEAKMWLEKAIKEAPYLREPYVEKAILEYQLKNWEEVYNCCTGALRIKEHKKTYINEPFCWDETIYDLLSISEYYRNNIKEAKKWIEKAILINPKNKRLLNNKIIIEKKEREND